MAHGRLRYRRCRSAEQALLLCRQPPKASLTADLPLRMTLASKVSLQKRDYLQKIAILAGIWVVLLALHRPLLYLPYYWDEAGYYVPAAVDFLRHGLPIPTSTL